VINPEQLVFAGFTTSFIRQLFTKMLYKRANHFAVQGLLLHKLRIGNSEID
jgi:hypothetical protein